MIYGWSEWLAVRGLMAAKRPLKTGHDEGLDVAGLRGKLGDKGTH